MSRNVILIRHAKSSWAQSGQLDYNRPLNQRGIDSIPVMGQWLKNQSFSDALLLHSSANRTTQTFEGIKPYIVSKCSKIQAKKDLYHASFKTISKIISETQKKFKTVIIVGHNPGITDCLNYLASENISNMPTLGIALISFDIDSWEEIHGGLGTLKSFEYPKSIAPEKFLDH